MSACESSLWDLLHTDLQHSIRVSALNLQKSEAREKYQTIRTIDFLSRHEDVEPTSRWYDLINELQELVQEIRVAEQCLGALGTEENDEMAEMQASLRRKDFGHTGLHLDLSDLDLEAEGL